MKLRNIIIGILFVIAGSVAAAKISDHQKIKRFETEREIYAENVKVAVEKMLCENGISSFSVKVRTPSDLEKYGAGSWQEYYKFYDYIDVVVEETEYIKTQSVFYKCRYMDDIQKRIASSRRNALDQTPWLKQYCDKYFLHVTNQHQGYHMVINTLKLKGNEGALEAHISHEAIDYITSSEYDGYYEQDVLSKNYKYVNPRITSALTKPASESKKSQHSINNKSNTKKGNIHDSYDDGYNDVYSDGDYNENRYRYDSDYANGVDDAMDEEGWDW